MRAISYTIDIFSVPSKRFLSGPECIVGGALQNLVVQQEQRLDSLVISRDG
jgi:hypothetical protein